jgi:hypothetical protein
MNGVIINGLQNIEIRSILQIILSYINIPISTNVADNVNNSHFYDIPSKYIYIYTCSLLA